MFLGLLVLVAVLAQLFTVYCNDARPSNALNDKWRMLKRARFDNHYDRYYRFYQWTGSNPLAITA